MFFLLIMQCYRNCILDFCLEYCETELMVYLKNLVNSINYFTSSKIVFAGGGDDFRFGKDKFTTKLSVENVEQKRIEL